MLKVLFFSKLTKPAVPFLRFTTKDILFNFISNLHNFTLSVAYKNSKESPKFNQFFKKI